MTETLEEARRNRISELRQMVEHQEEYMARMCVADNFYFTNGKRKRDQEYLSGLEFELNVLLQVQKEKEDECNNL